MPLGAPRSRETDGKGVDLFNKSRTLELRATFGRLLLLFQIEEVLLQLE